MTDKLEQRMHEAFDQVHMPTDLAERTLARIEAERQAEAASEPASSPSPVASAPLTVIEGKAAHRTARKHRRMPLVAALAACLTLVALGIGGVAWAWQPYAYVAIDVNPSIELGINRFDRVASTRAYNDDGERVLAAADVQGDTYEQAMTSIEQALQDYLDDTSAIEVTIICDDRHAASQLEDVGTRCLDASGTGQVHCSHASEEEHHAAHEEGLGVGKWRVWRELVDAGSDLTAEDAADMSVRELSELLEGTGSTSGHHGGRHRGQAGHD